MAHETRPLARAAFDPREVAGGGRVRRRAVHAPGRVRKRRRCAREPNRRPTQRAGRARRTRRPPHTHRTPAAHRECCGDDARRRTGTRDCLRAPQREWPAGRAAARHEGAGRRGRTAPEHVGHGPIPAREHGDRPPARPPAGADVPSPRSRRGAVHRVRRRAEQRGPRRRRADPSCAHRRPGRRSHGAHVRRGAHVAHRGQHGRDGARVPDGRHAGSVDVDSARALSRLHLEAVADGSPPDARRGHARRAKRRDRGTAAVRFILGDEHPVRGRADGRRSDTTRGALHGESHLLRDDGHPPSRGSELQADG